MIAPCIWRYSQRQSHGSQKGARSNQNTAVLCSAALVLKHTWYAFNLDIGTVTQIDLRTKYSVHKMDTAKVLHEPETHMGFICITM